MSPTTTTTTEAQRTARALARLPLPPAPPSTAAPDTPAPQPAPPPPGAGGLPSAAHAPPASGSPVCRHCGERQGDGRGALVNHEKRCRRNPQRSAYVPPVRIQATLRAAALLGAAPDHPADPLDDWLIANAARPIAAQAEALEVSPKSIRSWRQELLDAGRIAPTPHAERGTLGAAARWQGHEPAPRLATTRQAPAPAPPPAPAAPAPRKGGDQMPDGPTARQRAAARAAEILGPEAGDDPLTAYLLRHQGEPRADVARALGVDRRPVSGWYAALGAASAPRPPRPPANPSFGRIGRLASPERKARSVSERIAGKIRAALSRGDEFEAHRLRLDFLRARHREFLKGAADAS